MSLSIPTDGECWKWWCSLLLQKREVWSLSSTTRMIEFGTLGIRILLKVAELRKIEPRLNSAVCTKENCQTPSKSLHLSEKSDSDDTLMTPELRRAFWPRLPLPIKPLSLLLGGPWLHLGVMTTAHPPHSALTPSPHHPLRMDEVMTTISPTSPA